MSYTGAMLKVLDSREFVARQSPYFSGAIFSGKLLESTAYPTMWTNGINVYFNPNFVATLEVQAAQYYDKKVLISFVLLHEYLHKLLNHVGRKEWRNHKLWNQACDYSINPIILSMGYPRVPDMLYRSELTGMSAEKIYDLLVKEQEERRKGKQPGKPGGKPQEGAGDDSQESQEPQASDDTDDSKEESGQNEDGEDGNPGDDASNDSDDEDDGLPPQLNGDMVEPTKEELEEAETEANRMAAKLSSKAGNMPKLLKQALTEMFPVAKMDWRQIMEELARSARDNAEKSWRRPNRRYASTDMILPGEDTGKVFRLVVCFDVSGSMTGDSRYLKEMKSETASLLDDGLVTHVSLIATDTQITAELETTSGAEVEDFQTYGGGGTHFSAAMAKVCKADDAVACIFLTDMETSDFGQEPEFPVIWVNWGRKGATAPFGTVVDFDR